MAGRWTFVLVIALACAMVTADDWEEHPGKALHSDLKDYSQELKDLIDNKVAPVIKDYSDGFADPIDWKDAPVIEDKEDMEDAPVKYEDMEAKNILEVATSGKSATQKATSGKSATQKATTGKSATQKLCILRGNRYNQKGQVFKGYCQLTNDGVKCCNRGACLNFQWPVGQKLHHGVSFQPRELECLLGGPQSTFKHRRQACFLSRDGVRCCRGLACLDVEWPTRDMLKESLTEVAAAPDGNEPDTTLEEQTIVVP